MNKIITRSKTFVKSKIPKKKSKNGSDSNSAVRVTNETVAEVREDVLKSARKIIYPLSHSKHKVLIVSTALISAVVIGFFSYMIVALYKNKSTSDFTYKVSQILPFPVARVGGAFVPYENYLFEIKRYIFYYNNVEKINFDSPVYSPQLEEQKKAVLARVVDQAYIKKLAAEKNITVSDEEVDNRIETLKAQNRLGNNDKVFEDTLKDFYNWSVSDFRRSIRNDILTSKVLAVVDIEARSRANTALDELKNGADFATVAMKYSDDEQTKAIGGEISGLVNPKDRNTLSQQSEALAKLQPGQYSDVINLGSELEILKKLEDVNGQYRVAHIIIRFKAIDATLNELKTKEPSRVYIKL